MILTTKEIQGVPKKKYRNVIRTNVAKKSLLVCMCVVTYHIIPTLQCNIVLLE